MHEDLLGYLLGALDADEQRRIETELARSSELRSELRRLRECLEPLDSLAEPFEPPTGLAERVCEAVHRCKEDSDLWDDRPVPTSVIEARSRAASGRASGELAYRSYSLSDAVVLALVGLAAFTLFLPALANSRYAARITACQNNLRMLGMHLIDYSCRRSDGQFPFVPLAGNRSFAGIYAPVLVENELIPTDGSLPVCPGSDIAGQSDRRRIPSLGEIDAADGLWLTRLQEQAGGSYAYSIGFVENGCFQAVHNRGRSQFALLADTPSMDVPGQMGANHGMRGMNVCYEDGHVVFVTNPHVRGADDPLQNRLGFAEVGVAPDDSVVLSSGMRPIPPNRFVPLIKLRSQ